jgi:hypothetical protein
MLSPKRALLKSGVFNGLKAAIKKVDPAVLEAHGVIQ